MIHRTGSLALLACVLLGTTPIVSAQTSTTSSSSNDIQAVITGPTDVAVGRTIVLDATVSRGSGSTVSYQWFVAGKPQPISESIEAVYTPEKAETLVFSLRIRVSQPGAPVQETEAQHVVDVYNRKIVLVADSSIPSEKLALHAKTASDAGVFLRILRPNPSASPLGNEEALSTLLTEQADSFAGANVIVLWTDGISGLQSLLRAVQGNDDLIAGVGNQTIILLADGSLATLARTARGPYSVLRPQQILLTRKEALDPLLQSPGVDAFVSQLQSRDMEYLVINASTAGLRPWNLLSSLVNAMLTKGVPSQTVILLLVLPFIAMILAFLRQVIGVTSFGLYTPSIIALSFLALGWQLGVFFLLFILITGYATRALMKRWRMLYIPKVAVILTVVSVTLLILMGLMAYIGITFSRETIFILLIMSTLTESFLALKSEEGWKTATLGVLETIGASLLCVFIVQWPVFQSLILAYPEVIVLTVIVNVILGRFTGLRLMEYFRFKEVFRHLQEE